LAKFPGRAVVLDGAGRETIEPDNYIPRSKNVATR